jgi:hypothetical protein
MNPLKQLQHYGQSPWLDFIQRSLVTGGGLQRLIVMNTGQQRTYTPRLLSQTDHGEDKRRSQARQPNEATGCPGWTQLHGRRRDRAGISSLDRRGDGVTEQSIS